MSDDPEAAAILTRFRAALGEVYGDRLERVVLYGSRACGDHRPDSDYDIAVFIKDPGTLGEEIRRLAGGGDRHSLGYRGCDQRAAVSGRAYRERTGFMHELRQDGRDL